MTSTAAAATTPGGHGLAHARTRGTRLAPRRLAGEILRQPSAKQAAIHKPRQVGVLLSGRVSRPATLLQTRDGQPADLYRLPVQAASAATVPLFRPDQALSPAILPHRRHRNSQVAGDLPPPMSPKADGRQRLHPSPARAWEVFKHCRWCQAFQGRRPGLFMPHGCPVDGAKATPRTAAFFDQEMATVGRRRPHQGYRQGRPACLQPGAEAAVDKAARLGSRSCLV